MDIYNYSVFAYSYFVSCVRRFACRAERHAWKPKRRYRWRNVCGRRGVTGIRSVWGRIKKCCKVTATIIARIGCATESKNGKTAKTTLRASLPARRSTKQLNILPPRPLSVSCRQSSSSCNRNECKITYAHTEDNADFTEYNDTMVRRLVEYIRVMKDKTIIIVLKGGLQIEEKLEQI